MNRYLVIDNSMEEMINNYVKAQCTLFEKLGDSESWEDCQSSSIERTLISALLHATNYFNDQAKKGE